MPCPHYDITIVKHGKASAVAKAAYQSGERLYSEREHRTKKYKKEEGEVVYTEIMLPPQAPPEYADRNILWNAVEAVEPNWNSQLARRFKGRGPTKWGGPAGALSIENCYFDALIAA